MTGKNGDATGVRSKNNYQQSDCERRAEWAL